VEPGLRVQLRRTPEVQAALIRDYYMTLSCPNCRRNIAVIANAAFVACPDCDEISSLPGDIVPVGRMFPREPERRRYGLGLGMTWQTLQKIHQELFTPT